MDTATAADADTVTEEDVVNGLDPEMRAVLDGLPDQVKTALVNKAMTRGAAK